MKNIASLKNIQKKVGDQTATLKDKAVATSGKFADLKEFSIEKIKGLINEINTTLPLIEKTGYRVNELELELGIAPGASIHLEKSSDVSEEVIHSVLEQHNDKAILATIVKALSKTHDLQEGMKIGKFAFSEVELELGISPKIKMKYLPNGNSDKNTEPGETNNNEPKNAEQEVSDKIDVICGSCNRIVGKVPRSKIPENGLTVKCPKCKENIFLK